MAQSRHVDEIAVFELLFGNAHDEPNPILNNGSLLHMAGSSGFSGDYQGSASIGDLLHRMAKLTDDTLHFSLLQVLVGNDQAVVMRGHVDAIRRGRQLDGDVLFALAVEGGTVREMWVFHSNQDQVDEFWST